MSNPTAIENIIVKGVREHNLKDIDLTIPKNKLVVFTGVSGSGKSSLAMDTIYAEGQRRYVESLSAYARQFLGVMGKPDVDSIEGLSPAIAIDQKTTSRNPRSTVGTITEVYDFLRLLYARVGHPHCSECGREISRQSTDQIVDNVLGLLAEQQGFGSERGARFFVLAPVVKDRKGEYSALFDNLKRQGFVRARVDGAFCDLNEHFELIKTNKHTIDAVVSRHVVTAKKLRDKAEVKSLRSELTQSVETALRLGSGNLIIAIIQDKGFDFSWSPKQVEDHLFSENFACPECNISLPDLEPRSFSFNSPHGACATCDGLGTQLSVDENLVVNPRLSVSEGGLLPWSNLFDHYTWTARKLAAVAQHYDFSLDVPISELPIHVMEILLYGAPKKQKFSVKFGKPGRKIEGTYKSTYEGLIPNLLRRHKETKSDYVRNDIEKYMVREPCPTCQGSRLRKEAVSVIIDNKNIWEVSAQSIEDTAEWCCFLEAKLSERERTIAKTILREINYRLKFLLDVGLGYLTLSRTSAHLSGGEAQRIRLASQIGAGLSGVLYVLDEPSIGLHQRDQSKLINTLKHLRDLGNTVIVVEHDKDTMLESDYIFDFGPGAGEHGGKVVAQGTPKEIIKCSSKAGAALTGKYLAGKLVVGDEYRRLKKVAIEKGIDEFDVLEGTKGCGKRKNKHAQRRLAAPAIAPAATIEKDQAAKNTLSLCGATGRNLKNINIDLPLGKFICVTGVSGSGKSTLIMDTLYKSLRQEFGLKNDVKPEPHTALLGTENITNVIAIDQSPIGRTPKSNPATYTKTFDHIRQLFAQTQEARIRGYKAGRFSFNVKGGRCEACRGEGQIKIEMQFMPDVYVNCEVCQGRRYNREALEIYYKGKNISDVLNMTVEEAMHFFENIPPIYRKIKTINDVGLGYIRLGQPAPTLSGGEAQRVKLSLELSKRYTGSTFYILDEPTTGLHFADLERLISIIRRLTSKGNTVLVIEHNLDVIANCDHVIDLGPEGGEAGGEVIFAGGLRELLQHDKSYTAQALKELPRGLKG